MNATFLQLVCHSGRAGIFPMASEKESRRSWRETLPPFPLNVCPELISCGRYLTRSLSFGTSLVRRDECSCGFMRDGDVGEVLER